MEKVEGLEEGDLIEVTYEKWAGRPLVSEKAITEPFYFDELEQNNEWLKVYGSRIHGKTPKGFSGKEDQKTIYRKRIFDIRRLAVREPAEV